MCRTMFERKTESMQQTYIRLPNGIPKHTFTDGKNGKASAQLLLYIYSIRNMNMFGSGTATAASGAGAGATVDAAST